MNQQMKPKCHVPTEITLSLFKIRLTFMHGQINQTILLNVFRT